MSKGIVVLGLVAIMACMCFVQADDKGADDDINDAAHSIHAFRRAGPKNDDDHDDHAHDQIQGHDDDLNGNEQEHTADSLQVKQTEELSVKPSEYFSTLLNRDDEAILTTSDNILGH